jgi:hypothetical protein
LIIYTDEKKLIIDNQCNWMANSYKIIVLIFFETYF